MAVHSAHLPMYLRISEGVVAAIREGKLKPGQRIPSEHEIMRRRGVSNTTARKAHQQLERDGWVARIKGKGTFVRQRAVDRSLDRILSFTRNMLQEGRTPSTEVLGVRVRRAPHSVTIQGRTYTIKGPMCVVERLRRADGVPMMLERRCIALEFCPGIQDLDLGQSLYRIYENDYGVHLTEVHQTLSAVVLAGKDLDWLGAAEPLPALCVDGVTFCGKELPLEVEHSIYRGDLYRFLVTATRSPEGQAHGS